jgi:Flp pilus assembly protein protease CpaA
MSALAAALLLAHATYTDLRWRVIRNWAVAGGAAAGWAIRVALHGMGGLASGAEGLAAGGVWWLAVRFLRLGAGDAKLAMALGAALGPGAAVAGPALGYVLCALGLVPWIAWRRARRMPWRDVPLPMAPWIAAGTVALAILRAG